MRVSNRASGSAAVCEKNETRCRAGRPHKYSDLRSDLRSDMRSNVRSDLRSSLRSDVRSDARYCSCGCEHKWRPCRDAFVNKMALLMDRLDANVRGGAMLGVCRVRKLRSMYLYMNRVIEDPQWLAPRGEEGVRTDAMGRFWTEGARRAAVFDAELVQVAARRPGDAVLAAAVAQARGTLSKFRAKEAAWRLANYNRPDALTDVLGLCLDLAAAVRAFL